MTKKEIQGSGKEINPTLLEKEKMDNAFTKMMLGQKRIKEAYCSYEISKLLKEKGFDEPCEYFYKFDDSSQKFKGSHSIKNSDLDGKFYNAPTHQMAMSWLREKYGYHISILWNCGDRTGKEAFIWGINNINNFEDKGYNGIGSNIYGETVEAAIKYCLENLL